MEDGRATAGEHGRPRPTKGKKPRSRAEQLLIDWAVALLAAMAAAVVLTQVLFINAQIPTQSMAHTIDVGDRVIGLRTAYALSAPRRGDIVIFRFPDDERQTYIKRVIGLPGETVTVTAGRVYIGGQAHPLDEPYVNGEPAGDFGPYTVPQGCYFVLGDNRQNSWDSRYWSNTFVRADAILGKAWFRLYPGLKWLE